jgi:hypothetical protein
MAPVNWGMQGIDAAIFFSCGGGVGVDPGDGARLVGGAVRAQLWCGRKKKVAGWAVRMGWAGREAEAQWERGGRKTAGWKKKNGPWLGRKTGWAESDGKNSAYSSQAGEGERSLNPDMRSPRAPGSGPFHQDVLPHALLDGPCPVWLPPRKVSSSIVWFPGASRVMWPVIPRIFSG